MPRTFSFGSVDLDVSVGRAALREPPEPDEPFRIAILGDFSGRSNRGLLDAKLAERRPLLVDRDNFEQTLAKLGLELRLPVRAGDGPQITIRFKELDDFRPDRIYERLELFQALRQTRHDLSDPSTFPRAAATIRGPSQPEPPQVTRERIERLPLGDLLEQAIEETETRAPEGKPSPRLRDEWSALLHDIVAPHLVPGAPPRQKELLAELDAATGSQMRSLLHQPAFQTLEAAWRGLFFLVRRLETGARLKLYLLDISKAELAADLCATPDLRRSETYRLLVEESVGTLGAPRWSVLVGDYAFDATRDDLELLRRLAGIALETGAPFLAAAGPHLLGCESLAETPDPVDWLRPLDPEVEQAWEAIRRLPEAVYIGLALPRFLLRLPYGKDTDPAEQFAFEEMPASPVHESYLWGNPALACVCLLGQAFSEYGWEFHPGVVRDIEGLPVHVYQAEGEPKLKPCAEVLLTERAAEVILDKGPMPLVSFAGRDTVRLLRFQSIASPPAPLAGRWA